MVLLVMGLWKLSLDEDGFSFLETLGVLANEAQGVTVFIAIFVLIVVLGLIFDLCVSVLVAEQEEVAVSLSVSKQGTGVGGGLRTKPEPVPTPPPPLPPGFFVGENLNELVEVVVKEGVEGEFKDLQLLDDGEV